MMKARLIAIGGIAALGLAGAGHAARPAPVPVQSAAVVAVPAGAVAGVALRADAGPLIFAHRPEHTLAVATSGQVDKPMAVELAAPGQAVLNTAAVARQREAAPTGSAAPLPGALWLFGSALLVFLGISARRSF